MKNTLVIATEPTYSLNFLIYLQNIYLNQNQLDNDYKFPYLSKIYAFREEFRSDFKVLWMEVSQYVSEHAANDLKLFHDEHELFYERLFVEHEENHAEFLEIHQSFKVWWGSFAGHFAIERFVSEEIGRLYKELATSLIHQKIVPKKQLHISLLYDECLLGGGEKCSYYAIIPINYFILNFEELLPKLQQHVNG